MIDCYRYCGCVKRRNTSDDQSSLSFFQAAGNLDIRYGLIGFRGHSVSCGWLSAGAPTQAAVSPNARSAINLFHEESATLLMLIRLP